MSCRSRMNQTAIRSPVESTPIARSSACTMRAWPFKALSMLLAMVGLLQARDVSVDIVQGLDRFAQYQFSTPDFAGPIGGLPREIPLRERGQHALKGGYLHEKPVVTVRGRFLSRRCRLAWKIRTDRCDVRHGPPPARSDWDQALCTPHPKSH